MYVDLARERGNPRQLQEFAARLGVAAAPDAVRILTRLRRLSDGDQAASGPVAARRHPRALARAAGWRGDPARLTSALVQAHIADAKPSGISIRPAFGGHGERSGGGAPRSALRPAPVLWQAALGELAVLVNHANYEAFLADTVGLFRCDAWLTVGVPSAYALAALSDRFRSAMEWALYVVSGERLRVRLVHAPPPGPPVHLAPV